MHLRTVSGATNYGDAELVKCVEFFMKCDKLSGAYCGEVTGVKIQQEKLRIIGKEIARERSNGAGGIIWKTNRNRYRLNTCLEQHY